MVNVNIAWESHLCCSNFLSFINLIFYSPFMRYLLKVKYIIDDNQSILVIDPHICLWTSRYEPSSIYCDTFYLQRFLATLSTLLSDKTCCGRYFLAAILFQSTYPRSVNISVLQLQRALAKLWYQQSHLSQSPGILWLMNALFLSYLIFERPVIGYATVIFIKPVYHNCVIV